MLRSKECLQNVAAAVSKQDLRWLGRDWREDEGSGPLRRDCSAYQKQQQERKGKMDMGVTKMRKDIQK